MKYREELFDSQSVNRHWSTVKWIWGDCEYQCFIFSSKFAGNTRFELVHPRLTCRFIISPKKHRKIINFKIILLSSCFKFTSLYLPRFIAAMNRTGWVRRFSWGGGGSYYPSSDILFLFFPSGKCLLYVFKEWKQGASLVGPWKAQASEPGGTERHNWFYFSGGTRSVLPLNSFDTFSSLMSRRENVLFHFFIPFV